MMHSDVAPVDSRTRPSRCAVAHAWMRADTYALLESAAHARHQHPDQLAAYILERVLIGAKDVGYIDVCDVSH